MRDPTKTEGGEGDKKVRNEVLCKLIDRVKLEEKKRFRDLEVEASRSYFSKLLDCMLSPVFV